MHTKDYRYWNVVDVLHAYAKRSAWEGFFQTLLKGQVALAVQPSRASVAAAPHLP